MFSDNQKISLRQVQILLILDMFGTAVITLPRRTAEYAAQDGWVIVIAMALLMILYAFILVSLCNMFKNETIVEFGKRLLPKFIYYIVILGLIVKIVIGTAMELRAFSEIVNQMLLQNTPVQVIIITLLLTASLVARKGFETRARLAEILIVLMFIPLFVILLVLILHPSFENLMPILKTPPKDIIRGIGELGFSFHGLEFLLLLYPFLSNKENNKKSILEAITILGIAMVFITIITIERFGAKDVKHQIWPVLELMQSFDLPGSFMERQDAFVISFWILSVFMLVSAGLHFTSIILARMSKATESFHFVLPLIPIIYIIALLPHNIAQTYSIMDWFERYFGIAYLLVIPLVLILIAKLKGGKIKNEK